MPSSGLHCILSRRTKLSNLRRTPFFLIKQFFPVRITQQLSIGMAQLRLIQDAPFNNRSAWSVEKFHAFYIHSKLQWPADNDKNRTVWNTTFLAWTKPAGYIVYETKDVHATADHILQLEHSCLNSTNHTVEYSSDLGAQWSEIPNDSAWHLVPIPFTVANVTFARLTIPLHLLSNGDGPIRFRLRFSTKCSENPLQYLYVGSKCPLNCFGNGRCKHGQCEPNQSILPIVCILAAHQLSPKVFFALRLIFVRLSRKISLTPTGFIWMRTNKTAIGFNGRPRTGKRSHNRSISDQHGLFLPLAPLRTDRLSSLALSNGLTASDRLRKRAKARFTFLYLRTERRHGQFFISTISQPSRRRVRSSSS